MIEGGGLGTFAPEDIGPLDVQVANGVVDVAVADEAEAVAVARRYLSYFAGPVDGLGLTADPARLRDLVPENRRQAYDVRAVVDGLADNDSVLELRPASGVGDGHRAGPGRGPAARHRGQQPRPPGRRHRRGRGRQGGPVPAAVRRLRPAGAVPVRHARDHGGARGRGHRAGAPRQPAVRHRRQPRRARSGRSSCARATGSGAQTMAGGSFKAPLFCVAWPTGEVGGMGLEGAVRLGFRSELDAIDDEAERERRLPAHGRGRLRARQGAQLGLATSRSTT